VLLDLLTAKSVVFICSPQLFIQCKSYLKCVISGWSIKGTDLIRRRTTKIMVAVTFVLGINIPVQIEFADRL